MTAAAHTLAIIRDEQRRRGWYVSWSCQTKGCEARGNVTTPRREKAMKVFALVAEGHRQQEAQ